MIRLCIGLFVVAVGISFLQVNPLSQVKKGEKILTCEMKDGTKEIDPKMVKSFYEGTWFFTNGYAKSCTLTEK